MLTDVVAIVVVVAKVTVVVVPTSSVDVTRLVVDERLDKHAGRLHCTAGVEYFR